VFDHDLPSDVVDRAAEPSMPAAGAHAATRIKTSCGAYFATGRLDR
jgi:hypothetical protein